MKTRWLVAAALVVLLLFALRLCRCSGTAGSAPPAQTAARLLPPADYPAELWRDTHTPPSPEALHILRGSEDELPAELHWQRGLEEPEIGDPAALKGGCLRLSNAGPFPANFLAFGSPSPQFFHYNCFERIELPLVESHPVTGRAIPGVACAWATQGRCVFFRLDAEARYSNGRPVRAGDYALGAHLRRRLAEMGGPAADAAAQEAGLAEIRVLADDLLMVKLRHEAGDRAPLQAAALLHAAEPSFYADFGSDYTELYRQRIPPTSGAYTIGRIERGRMIELRRVAGWWAEKRRYRRYTCNVDAIEHHFLTDEAQAREFLLRGKLDLLQTRDLVAWRDQFESGTHPAVRDGLIELHRFRADYPMPPYGIAFNTKRLPDVDLRRGIMQAMDMPGVLELLYLGEGEQLGTFSSGYGALTPRHTPSCRYDPAAARAAFARAGYGEAGSDGILRRADGQRLSVRLGYTPSEKNSAAASLLAQRAAACGLELRLEPLPWQLSASQLQRGEHELIFWATMASSPLPDYRRFFTSDARGYDAPFLLADARMDAAVAAMEQAGSDAERAAAMAEVDRLVAELAVWLPGHKENLVLLACRSHVRFPDCDSCRFSTPGPYEVAEAHLYWIDPQRLGRGAGHEVSQVHEAAVRPPAAEAGQSPADPPTQAPEAEPPSAEATPCAAEAEQASAETPAQAAEAEPLSSEATPCASDTAPPSAETSPPR